MKEKLKSAVAVIVAGHPWRLVAAVVGIATAGVGGHRIQARRAERAELERQAAESAALEAQATAAAAQETVRNVEEIDAAAREPGAWGTSGPCSTFGGPRDTGMSKTEGLALMSEADLARGWWFSSLCNAGNAGGMAHKLNPEAFYVACRWNYAATSKEALRWAVARVTAKGRTVWCRPVDWGPAEWTGKAVDLSPGAARTLGVVTGDVVSVQLYVP